MTQSYEDEDASLSQASACQEEDRSNGESKLRKKIEAMSHGQLMSRIEACCKTQRTLAVKTAENKRVLTMCQTQLVNMVLIADVVDVAKQWIDSC